MSQLLAEAVQSELDLADWLVEALTTVPRSRFLDQSAEDYADEDTALPMGRGHLSVQPSVLARMLMLGRPRSSDRVLEIGAGSGYMTALVCFLGARVTAIEQEPRLARRARSNLAALGMEAQIIEGDGQLPPSVPGPWDLVLFGGAMPSLDLRWRTVLSAEGRVVAPLGSPWQHLTCARPSPAGWQFTRDIPVDFAMLTAGARR